jgi:uncharacterized protein YebE (UPF0316 family)
MKLHVVGRITAPVAHFIGPGMGHLRARGQAQHLLALDRDAARVLSSLLPADLPLTVVPTGEGVAHWAALGRAYAALLSQHRVEAVHFHGQIGRAHV